ncbi:hypothetical protein ACFXAE_07225 [Streptomyces sp. NPDC059454]|uniref:hypothetical protein n=1 Tax=Streptomyces sp. NPDC059454 TaxID=3346836 RepID=UPI0036ACC8FF
MTQAQQEEVEIEVVDRGEARRKRRAECGEGPHPDAYESGLATREEQEAAWKPLAQVSQADLFAEGDGALYRMVPRADLAVPRFDRTELVYQC